MSVRNRVKAIEDRTGVSGRMLVVPILEGDDVEKANDAARKSLRVTAEQVGLTVNVVHFGDGPIGAPKIY